MSNDEYKSKFDKVLDHLKTELGSIRTGRATPALIENLKVGAYEGTEPMSLVQLASISVPEARQLLVEPWDKSVLKAIEKTIQESDLGLGIANDGVNLRLTMPLMTEQILKVLNTKLEDARISLRNQRDKIKDDITSQEKNKEIGEDEKYNMIETLDKSVKEYNEKIKEMGENKEKEISV
jgi:ribosome recycling factor